MWLPKHADSSQEVWCCTDNYDEYDDWSYYSQDECPYEEQIVVGFDDRFPFWFWYSHYHLLCNCLLLLARWLCQDVVSHGKGPIAKRE